MNHLMNAEEACRVAAIDDGKFKNLVSLLAGDINRMAKIEKFDAEITIDKSYASVAKAAKAVLIKKGYEVEYNDSNLTFKISWANGAHYGY